MYPRTRKQGHDVKRLKGLLGDARLGGSGHVRTPILPGMQSSEANCVLDNQEREPVTGLEEIQRKIAASVACHAAIKVNMPLDHRKMQWLLEALSRTESPMTCPHGRPVVLKYSMREILKAFHRI